MTSITTPNLLNAANCGTHSSNDELKALAKDIKDTAERVLIVETKFYGPTDHKGARIKATLNGCDFSRTVGYDHAMGPEQAHLYAALFMLSNWFEGESLVLIGHSWTQKGWQYVFKFDA